jgi:4-amino-4-deoxy-L-arabinose transferase-like glycosyltransferase
MSFYRLGSLTLFDVDEAVFAEATKEMIQSGDWITPTYNGVVRYDKPILFYWAMAASYKIFGINEFGARFPSAVSGLLTCLALFLFVRRLSNGKTALYAFLSFVLSIYFLIYSHAAVTDMVLTLFITLSLFSFFLSETEKAGASVREKWYSYGFYLFSALAFLTKGLIGIIFPFGIAVIYRLFTERLSGVRKVFSLRGLTLFFIIAAPWYIAEFAINGREFIEQFFIKHHLMRYTGVISGHRGPVYYYILVLLVGLFPWIAFLPGGIVDVVTEGIMPHSSAMRLFALIWFAFIVLFFSLATTKLPNYILPAVPAMVILIASGMSEKGGRAIKYSQGFIATVSLLMGIAFLVSKKYLLQTGIPETGWTLTVAAVMTAMAALSAYAALSKKTLYGFISALMIIFLLLLSTTALPIANQYLQGSLHKFSLYARGRLSDDERVIAYGINNPSIVFYSGHKVTNISRAEALSELARADSRLIVISKIKDIDMLEGLGLKLQEQSGKYAILEK